LEEDATSRFGCHHAPLFSGSTTPRGWVRYGLIKLSICSIIALPICAADWPQYRGQQRNGHSAETGLLREWPQEGPKLLWQVNNVGSGFSTPSVVGGRIYLLGNEGLTNEFALALASQDGRRLWSAKLGKVGRPNQSPNFPGARSTPTVDGKLLYALGSDGDLVCWSPISRAIPASGLTQNLL